MGLHKALVEHNFPDLPENLDWEAVEESKLGLKRALQKKYGNNVKEKVASLNRFIQKIKDGKVPRGFHREDYVALTMVLMELNGERRI